MSLPAKTQQLVKDLEVLGDLMAELDCQGGRDAEWDALDRIYCDVAQRIIQACDTDREDEYDLARRLQGDIECSRIGAELERARITASFIERVLP